MLESFPQVPRPPTPRISVAILRAALPDRAIHRYFPAIALALVSSCGVIDGLTGPRDRDTDDAPDAGVPLDAPDAGLPLDAPDAGLPNVEPVDGGSPDAGSGPVDAGFKDPGSTVDTWTWRGALRLDPSASANADQPVLAVRPDGRLFVAWSELDSAAQTSTIWLATRAPGAIGWGEPKKVPVVSEAPFAFYPQLAASTAGAVVAYLTERATDLNPSSVRVARLDETLTVGTGDIVRVDDPTSHSPELGWGHAVAVDEDGHAIVTWHDNERDYLNVSAAGLAWTGAHLLDLGTGGLPLADVAASRGNALLAWPRGPGTYAGIGSIANGRLVAGEPHTLDAVYTGRPHAALRGSKGLVVWRAGAGLGFAQYENGWLPSGAIAGAMRVGDRVVLAMNTAGRAVAVWLQTPASTSDMWAANLYGATFDGRSWSAPRLLSLAGDNRHVWSIDVDMNEHGDAVAVWADFDEGGTYARIFANVLRASAGTWSGPVAIDVDSPSAPHATQPENDRSLHVVLKPDGTGATVVWTQEAQIRVPHVWWNRLE